MPHTVIVSLAETLDEEHFDAPSFQRVVRSTTEAFASLLSSFIASGGTPPRELASILEDVANEYLDLSDTVNEIHR
ncbi:hypothetical protein [Aureimonas populi]|uniref:Uncharacterized protein n=1 Tax=Aureimonas populi TaxID=1701758 RepID=A0ABW5CIL5_9HYPH|nr:hypothetical protein [Aureimonas populi]